MGDAIGLPLPPAWLASLWARRGATGVSALLGPGPRCTFAVSCAGMPPPPFQGAQPKPTHCPPTPSAGLNGIFNRQ